MDSGDACFIFLVKLALVTLAIGWIPALIAKNKGRDFLTWWIYGGALFLIALIHAIVIKPINPLDDRHSQQQALHPSASKTTCDRCGMSFTSHFYLQRVGSDKYLCENCRQMG